MISSIEVINKRPKLVFNAQQEYKLESYVNLDILDANSLSVRVAVLKKFLNWGPL